MSNLYARTRDAVRGPGGGQGASEFMAVADGYQQPGLHDVAGLGRAAMVDGKPAYPYPVTLSTDAAGKHWMLSSGFCDVSGRCRGGFNGWIEDGQLATLQPADGSVVSEAW